MTKHSWFREYCEKSTAHCMEYFVMKQRSVVEKTFWIFAFLLVLFLSTTNIMSAINIWINNPTIIVVKNTESSISDIPFPSITICSSNQLRKSTWERYMNTNSSYWDYLRFYRSMICTGNDYSPPMKLHPLEYIDSEVIKDLVKDCPISCPEVFQSTEVKWQNSSTKRFCNLVQPVLTLIGLCFILNMVPANQMFNDKYYKRYSNFYPQYMLNRTTTPVWSQDDGYNIQYNYDDFPFDIIPARTSGISYYHRLILRLHVLNNDFLKCPNRNFIPGSFIIVFNNPGGLYNVNSRVTISPDTYTKVQITPFVKKVSTDLKSRSPNVRQCYFENEKKLMFFKYYNEVNCFYECILNTTLSKCGCIRWDWTFLAEKGEKICGPSKYSCIQTVRADVKSSYGQKQCNCLSACTVINYQVTDSSHFDDWEYLKTAKLVNNNSRGATVEFIFKNAYFTAYQANSTFNIYSLFSVIGGMLGLFLGLSILNVFEIVYVITEIIIYYIVRIFKK